MIDAGIKFPIRGDYTNFDAIENVLLYMFQIPTDRYPNRKPVPIHFYGILLSRILSTFRSCYIQWN